MAPSTTTRAATDKPSFTVAKKILGPAEFERMACAFLNSEDIWKFDAKAAAAQYGAGDTKPESFKRGISNAVKKIREAMEKGDDLDGEDGQAVPPATAKGKAKSGRKRKATEVENAEAGGETARKQKKTMGVKKGKKDSASPEAGAGWAAVNGVEGEKEETLVKAEEGEDELA